jgi:hypothetical protein
MVDSVVLDVLVPVCFYSLFQPKVDLVRVGVLDCSKCEWVPGLVRYCVGYKPIDKVEPEYKLG